jgi:hypothetical protein
LGEVAPDSIGSINKRTMVQANLGIKTKSYSKVNKIKSAGVVTQVVEHLYNKCYALSSNTNTAKNKEIK